MTAARSFTLVLLAGAGLAWPTFAQSPPPRPVDTPRTVTLSLAEYNRLIDLAARPPQGPAAAPVPAVLSGADLRVRVNGETVRGVFSLTGEVLRSGYSRVGLMSGATLLEASAAGRPLPLVADGNVHTALIPGPGPFALSLEWGAPLVVAPGRASFVLPVPQAGTARATFDVPGDQADVRLSAGLITRRSVTNGRTIVEATLDPGAATEVSWSLRDSAPQAAARDLRTLAQVMTLISLRESDVQMVALIDLSVVQGELRSLAIDLPAGYELTGISGQSLERSEPRDRSVVVTIGDPAARSHQFLVTLERPHAGDSFALDTGVVAVPGAQRERGEIAVEGVGTLELAAAERSGMHRIDARELSGALQAIARLPVLAAFRYQRSATVVPGVALDVKRFADAGVLAAVADHATAATLVTREGRALTEVTLTLRNRAQPFLKVDLPAGATIVSVELAGETAKPVAGSDGTRVPLMRPGLPLSAPYRVSFVYMHAGTPFQRRGDIDMTLPRMDVPIGIVEWEVFFPEDYSVRAVGGNALDAGELEERYGEGWSLASRAASTTGVAGRGTRVTIARSALPGQIRGRVTDSSDSVLPGVTVDVVMIPGGSRSAVTSPDGTFVISGVPAGRVEVTATLHGFAPGRVTFTYDPQQPRQVDLQLEVSALTETVTVSADAPAEPSRKMAEAPSVNVLNLQRRVTGVLPIPVDVPRAGTLHRFVRPLVIEDATLVTLRYKRK